jgi:hypothetical protein
MPKIPRDISGRELEKLLNRVFVDTNIFIYAIMIRKFFGVKIVVMNINERVRQNGNKKDINFL